MSYFDMLRSAKEPAKENGGLRHPKARGMMRREIVRDIVPPPEEPSPPRPRTAVTPKPVRPRPAIEPPSPGPRPPLRQPAERPTKEPSVAIRTWVPERRRRVQFMQRMLALAAFTLLALAVILPTAVFPRFTIAIVPKLERVSVPPTNLTADTLAAAPSSAGRRIPALRIVAEKQLTREYEATGTKFFQERARGTVLLFNAFSSQPQSLVANTRLQDSSGRVFRLRSAVIIPGARVEAGKIQPTAVPAEVVAAEPGEASNIGAAEFRIPGFRGTSKYGGFYAKSEKPFSGGFVGQASVVQAADVTAASEDLTRRAVEELKGELDAKAPTDPDFIAPEGGREIAIVRIDQPPAGERMERFPVRVVVRGELIAVRRSQLGQLLGAIMLLATAETDGLSIAPHQPALELRGLKQGSAACCLNLAVSGALDYWRAPSSAELRSVLLDSTPAKAEAYLRGRPEIGEFSIKRFPRWLWFIPQRTGGLEITIRPPV